MLRNNQEKHEQTSWSIFVNTLSQLSPKKLLVFTLLLSPSLANAQPAGTYHFMRNTKQYRNPASSVTLFPKPDEPFAVLDKKKCFFERNLRGASEITLKCFDNDIVMPPIYTQADSNTFVGQEYRKDISDAEYLHYAEDMEIVKSSIHTDTKIDSEEVVINRYVKPGK